MVVTDCTLSSAGADIGTSLKCSTAAGQGTELEFRVVSGDYKGTSICGDANIELDLAKRKTNCVGPCLYICHTCIPPYLTQSLSLLPFHVHSACVS